MKSTAWIPPPPLNPRAYPFVPLAISFALGVALARWNGYATSTFLGGALVVFALAWLAVAAPARRGKAVRNGLSVVGLLLLIGLGYWRAATVHPPNRADFFTDGAPEVELLIRVDRVRPGDHRLRLESEVEARRKAEETGSASGKVLAYLDPTVRAARLSPGDRLLIKGRVVPILPPDNPHAFDGQKYWADQGVFHRLYVAADEDWLTVDTTRRNWNHRAEQLRLSWLNSFRPYLVGDELAVAAALVLGKRDLLSPELRSAYADTGAVHVLAVSGLHVGIVAALLLGLFGWLLPRRPWTEGVRTLLAIIGSWCFAWLTGFSPSVQRAATMFTVLLIGRLFRRKSYLVNTLAAAALLMLVVSPGQLFQLGFQLSFAAVLGIALFYRPLERALYFPRPWMRKIGTVLSVSLAAQLGTLPFSLYYFHQWPLYFLLSGSIVILTAYGALCLGLLHGLLYAVFPLAAGLSGHALNGVVWLQNAVVHLGRNLPGARQETAWLNYWELVAYTLIIGAIAVWLKWRKFRILSYAFSLGILLSLFRLTQVQSLREQRFFVVYRVADATLADFVSGDRAFRLRSEGIRPDREAFAADNHRRAREYNVVASGSPRGLVDSSVAVPGLAYSEGPLLEAVGKRWLLLNERFPQLPEDLRGVDYVLLSKGHRYFEVLNFLDENPAGEGPVFILDSSNGFTVTERYRTRSAGRTNSLKIIADGAEWARLPD